MEEHKNIDRIYQEKFKDFEVFPEPVVWKNIERNLMKKKKNRIFPLWLRLGSAAAILIGVTLSGLWYINQPESVNLPVEISIKNSTPAIKDRAVTNEDKKDLPAADQRTATKQTKQIPVQTRTSSKAIASRQNEGIQEKGNETKSSEFQRISTESLADNQDKNKNATTLTNGEMGATEEDLTTAQRKMDLNAKTNIADAVLAKSEEDKTEVAIELTEPFSKWSIGSSVAPVFYNAMGKGSPIDPDLADNDKSANTGISYGIKVNYKITDRFTLQSGINTVELGYETRNAAVLLSSSLVNGSNANINSALEGVGVDVVSTRQQNSETFSQRSLFDNSGKIDQSFNYLELPVEAKYALVQNKVSVNLVGGFSTYVLYQNNISVTSFGKTTSLGEASNINSVNFSGNVGLDLNFSLSKKLFFNTSPMLKYQFNTFSEDSGGFKPYFFGVYAGLNFRF